MLNETQLAEQLSAMMRTPDVPTVEQMIPLVEAFYAIPDNIVGGNLHIVLDDENVEKEHVIWCSGLARGRGDTIGYHLAELLLRMRKKDRRRVARSDRPWMVR